MKIQDAIKQNTEYWEKELAGCQKMANTHMDEVKRYNDAMLEAQIQIELYTKAAEILTTLDQARVDKVDVVKSKDTI